MALLFLLQSTGIVMTPSGASSAENARDAAERIDHLSAYFGIDAIG